jgi:hypothetical protein
MYRIASSLYADFSLGLLYGQAVLSQLRYNTGSGISYQAVGNGFAGTPLAPAKTENTNLAYTLARVQAGIAWQPSLRWFATIKGGVQQTVLQKASYDGMPLPAYSFPVGASLKLRLYGPIWAGAEVTYFGSGAGQANTATLFVLEYRR